MPAVRKDPLISESEFWDAKKVLKFLSEQDYFRDPEGGRPRWPLALQCLVSKDDSLGLTSDENWEQGMKCLGGVVWYLKHCLLEHDLLSQKRFQVYIPADVDENEVGAEIVEYLPSKCTAAKYMVGFQRFCFK